MQKTNAVKLILVGLVLILLAGCSTLSAGIAPSTSPVDDTNYTVLSQDEVSGSSFGVLVAGVSLSESSTAKSRDRALASNNADALIDVTTSNQRYNLGVITISTIKVSGKPIKFNQ